MLKFSQPTAFITARLRRHLPRRSVWLANTMTGKADSLNLRRTNFSCGSYMSLVWHNDCARSDADENRLKISNGRTCPPNFGTGCVFPTATGWREEKLRCSSAVELDFQAPVEIP